MLFASCSKEDSLNQGGEPGQTGSTDVVKDLRISLVSETVGTKTDQGTGTEAKLDGASVFIKQDKDGPDANANNALVYKYELVELKPGQTSTVVKYVEPGSKVYVLANCPFWTKTGAEAFLNDEVNKTGVNADNVFSEKIEGVDKPYIFNSR